MDQVQDQSDKPVNQLQKAAMVLIAIGAQNASQILKNLTQAEVEKVTVEIARQKTVPPERLEEALQDYYLQMMASQYIVQGGIPYARTILETALGIKKAEELLKRLEASTDDNAFYLLQGVEDKQLINFLQNEHPQTAALILANLKPAQAGAILPELPEDLQHDITYRIATMGKTSPELIKRIEEVIRGQFGAVLGSEFGTTGGIETMADILTSASRSTDQALMAGLEEKDPELAAEIKNLMFIFEDIVGLPDNVVQRIVKEVDTKSLALALKATSKELKDRIFKNMSERAAELLQDEIQFLGPVRVRDVEAAQQQILDIMHGLEDSGEIVLSQGEEEEIVE